MGNNYPYIADKRLFAAVMGACRYIRETGYFNKAVSYYADKYDLPEEAIAKEVRKRQAAGQRLKKESRSYKYFVVARYSRCDADQEPNLIGKCVVRASSRENAKKRFYEIDLKETRANDYGGSYAPYFWSDVIAEFDTKEEAEKLADNLKGGIA